MDIKLPMQPKPITLAASNPKRTVSRTLNEKGSEPPKILSLSLVTPPGHVSI